MAQSAPALAIRYFFIDLIGGIVAFPVWWYTHGLVMMAKWAGGSVSSASAYLGLGVWVKNLFVPMYGETSWQGRLISFAVRFFMIVLKGIGVGTWAVLTFAAFAVYVAVLPLAVIGIIYHAIGAAFV